MVSISCLKIKGGAYYINSPTNIGLYVFRNKNCLVIDTPLNSSAAKKIDEEISSCAFHPRYVFNTHHHLDHCGSNSYFRNKYPGCEFFSSKGEKVFIENNFLYSSILWGGIPCSQIEWSSKEERIDAILEEGINKINDEKFEIIDLGGHSKALTGIITPEKVFYISDSIFSEEKLQKYKIPYIYDINNFLISIDKILSCDAEFFLPGHSCKVYDKQEIEQLATKNVSAVEFFKDQIYTFLKNAFTKEEIVENIIILNELSVDFKQYMLISTTVAGYLEMFISEKLISYSVQDGKLYFYRE